MEWVDFNIRFFKSYDLGPCVHACIQFTNTSWDRVGPSVFGSNCVRKRKKKKNNYSKTGPMLQTLCWLGWLMLGTKSVRLLNEWKINYLSPLNWIVWGSRDKVPVPFIMNSTCLLNNRLNHWWGRGCRVVQSFGLSLTNKRNDSVIRCALKYVDCRCCYSSGANMGYNPEINVVHI